MNVFRGKGKQEKRKKKKNVFYADVLWEKSSTSFNCMLSLSKYSAVFYNFSARAILFGVKSIIIIAIFGMTRTYTRKDDNLIIIFLWVVFFLSLCFSLCDMHSLGTKMCSRIRFNKRIWFL